MFDFLCITRKGLLPKKPGGFWRAVYRVSRLSLKQRSTRPQNNTLVVHCQKQPVVGPAFPRPSVSAAQQPNSTLFLTPTCENVRVAHRVSVKPKLEAAVGELSLDTAVRAIVFSSGVPGVFCAGADLKERASMSDMDAEIFVARLRTLMTKVASIPAPTIAAVEGAGGINRGRRALESKRRGGGVARDSC